MPIAQTLMKSNKSMQIHYITTNVIPEVSILTIQKNMPTHNTKSSTYVSFGFNAQVKDFSFYGDIDYNSRDYTALACTTYSHPSVANLQVNYNFTPDFYIGVCLQHVTGEYQSKTTTVDGSFHSVVENHYKDKKIRPWVIIRYTFRKNADKKHKLGKVLNSTEEGISIIK